MEGRKADMTAFQLAEELASHASPSPALAFLVAASSNNNESDNNNNSTRRKAASRNGEPFKRRAQRSQLDLLLEDHRRIALRGGTLDGDADRPNMHKHGATTPTTETASSFRPRQHALQDMHGHDISLSCTAERGSAFNSSSKSAALQETVLRWGLMKYGQTDDVFDDPVGTDAKRSGNGGASSLSSPFLRHSWRLMEAIRRATLPDDATSKTEDQWSVGQRWERSDDLVQVNALLTALQKEMTERPTTVTEADNSIAPKPENAYYQCGLQLCAECAHISKPLAAYFAVTPPLSSLSFLSFTEEEYNALTTPPPPPLPPSTFRFNYARSSYLFELWSRFGNAVVVVDRWAWDAKREEPQVPPSPRPSTSSLTERKEADESADHMERCVPSVEQVCAEYNRVCSGVLQMRQQRLLHAVLKQQQQRGHARDPASPTAVTSTSVDNAAANVHTPFAASFDRYTLLHSVKDEVEGREDRGSAAAQWLTPQPSPPPIDPHVLSPTASAVEVLNVGKAEGSACPTVTVSPPPAFQTSSSALTLQQRLTQCTTPHPWYKYAAELQRRADVEELLRCERVTNVPYQHAVKAYCAAAIKAAQALQRSSFVFDDRDRRELEDSNAEKRRETTKEVLLSDSLSSHNSQLELTAATDTFVSPPRDAFTVQLRPLPDVDPAAWQTAEVALRNAARAVLATTTFSLLSFQEPPPQRGRPPTHQGKRSRSILASAVGERYGGDASRSTRKRSKTKDNASGTGTTTAAAVQKPHKDTRRRTEAIDEEEVGDAQAHGRLDEGSRESSFTSNSSTVDSDDDEEAEEESESTSSEDGSQQDSDDSDDGDETAIRSSQKHNDVVAEDDVHNTEFALSLQPQQRHRRGGRGSLAANVSRLASRSSRVHAGPTYRALQEYIQEVIPFRCTRLRVAAQAGWMLPTPPALLHTLTDPLEESEVVVVDVDGRCEQNKNSSSNSNNRAAHKASAAAALSSPSATNGESTGSANKTVEDLCRPILTEEDYLELRKVNTATVCNRVVSHTGEAVLLSLPAAVPRVHREVEQELERYLYDDTSAMMEVNATAQSLVAEIRATYTQNIYLQRYAGRLEHIVENLRKVEQGCRETESATSHVGVRDTTNSL